MSVDARGHTEREGVAFARACVVVLCVRARRKACCVSAPGTVLATSCRYRLSGVSACVAAEEERERSAANVYRVVLQK